MSENFGYEIATLIRQNQSTLEALRDRCSAALASDRPLYTSAGELEALCRQPMTGNGFLLTPDQRSAVSALAQSAVGGASREFFRVQASLTCDPLH